MERGEKAATRERHSYFENSVNVPMLLKNVEKIPAEEVAKRVSMSGRVIWKHDGTGVLQLTMRRNRFSHSYEFAVDPALLKAQGMKQGHIKNNIGPNEMKQFGFSFNGSLLGQKTESESTPYEARYRIVNDQTKETYIITESLTDHWQASHSHKSYIERYYWGTPRGLTKQSFSLFSKRPDGTITQVEIARKDYLRRIERTFNNRGEMISEQRKTEGIFGTQPVESEANGVPHNVYMTKGAVIGTSKVLMPEVTLAEGQFDWIEEGGFNTELSDVFMR